MWAQLYSCDAFKLFKESGNILNSKLGRKLRKEVYEKSSVNNSADSYIKFAGREPEYQPILENYGFIKSEKKLELEK